MKNRMIALANRFVRTLNSSGNRPRCIFSGKSRTRQTESKKCALFSFLFSVFYFLLSISGFSAFCFLLLNDDALQIRIHGDASLPALIYLPGLHGDWTLVGGFRAAIRGRVRLVEITYPRTLTWSLDDYAAGVEAALAQNGISRGWLLAESFSSQVAWPLVARGKFPMDGVILAGGFVRHPMRWAVRLAERLAGDLSLSLLTRVAFPGANRTLAWCYSILARFRYRHSPETLANVREFLARRTPLDLKAARHRLHLIAQSELCAAASSASVPIFALTGWFDPIVPWFPVRRWLRKNCATLRDYEILWPGDHVVLASAPRASADQIVSWMGKS